MRKSHFRKLMGSVSLNSHVDSNTLAYFYKRKHSPPFCGWLFFFLMVTLLTGTILHLTINRGTLLAVLGGARMGEALLALIMGLSLLALLEGGILCTILYPPHSRFTWT